MMLPYRKKNIAKAQSTYYDPPLKGWKPSKNFYDLNDDEAAVMDNILVDNGEVRLRYGSQDYYIGPNPVETLINYQDSAFLCATSDKIIDITDANNPVDKITGKNSGLYIFDNYKNNIYFVNGVDNAMIYDGSTIADTGFTGFGGIPTYVAVVHNRVFFAIRDSLAFAYGGPGEIQGALTSFPLDSYARKGGELLAIGKWTRDGGDGMDDLTVFITSMGEALVFQGTNPSDVNSWSLIGRFEMGQAFNNRCLKQWGGELLYLSRDGLDPISSALASGRTTRVSGIANDIRLPIRQNANNSAYWSMHHAANQALFYVNVPSLNSPNVQYVLNTDSGTWCSYSGLDALDFETFNGEVYFSTVNGVTRAETGFSDKGMDIVSDVLTANYEPGGKGRIKKFTQTEITLKLTGTMKPIIQLDIDARRRPFYGNVVVQPESSSKWNTSKWNATKWGIGDQLTTVTSGAGGNGRTAALRMRLASRIGKVEWVGTQLLYQVGGTSLR